MTRGTQMPITRASNAWLVLRQLEERIPLSVQHHLLPRLAPGYNPFTTFEDEHQAIFVHVPKTAGTSVTDTMGYREALHISIARYAAFDLDRCRRYFKFCFVRNPWDRLYSAFTYLRDPSIGPNRSVDTEWAEANLRRFGSFEEFVLALEKRGNRARLLRYIHFRPQLRWIRLPGATMPFMDFIGRFEKLEEDFESLSSRLSIRGTLARHRVQDKTPYREVYSHRMREIVATVYREDIALLGYSF